MLVDKKTVKKLTKLRTAMLDSKGREILNPKQMQIPVGMKKPQSLQDQIKKILREEVSMQAQAQEKESWEEANDFDVKDDFETDLIESQYELVELEEEFVKQNPFKPKQKKPIGNEGSEKPSKEESTKKVKTEEGGAQKPPPAPQGTLNTTAATAATTHS